MSNYHQNDIYSPGPPPPPVPARPDYYDSHASSGQAHAGGLSHEPERIDSPHPGFTAPHLPSRPEHDYVFRNGHVGSPGSSDDDFLPPRRRLTTGDIPVNSVGYARNPERVVAYLIPLPAPTRQGQVMQVPQVCVRPSSYSFLFLLLFKQPRMARPPQNTTDTQDAQRYMVYTPPAPHLLKPQGKEGKRHKLKRLAQQEVKKAKTFEGKTLSIRGLHSKTLRGCDWAVAAIKNADITFLNRVPRKQVNELILIHPASVLHGHSPEDVHHEFTAQLARTKRKAAIHSIISVALFPPALVIDTLAAIVWPFGGLAEIDGVWAYASLSGYLTARSVTRRLDKTPLTTPSESEQRQLRRELHGADVDGPEDAEQQAAAAAAARRTDFEAAAPPRRESRQVHFQEELDEEDEKMRGKNNAEAAQKKLKVRFVPDDAMETMAGYFHEICHKRNPRAFPSSGVPPTKTDVLASIGWWPDRRGRAPGVEHEGDWDDENVSLFFSFLFFPFSFYTATGNMTCENPERLTM